VKRLLALRLSALGDVIHTIPAVLTLRDALPDTDISWVVEAPYAELVATVAGVTAIPVRMKRWGRSLRSSRAEIRRALEAMRGADTSVDFQGLVKSAMLGWVARAQTRYGFDRRAIRETPALLFTNQKIHVDTTRHVVDQNLQLVAALTANRRPPTANWNPFLESVPGAEDSVVLLPGAGKTTKLWPVDRFRELARRIGERALVVWGPGEEALAREIGARMAPATNLRELAWILRQADAVVGADTGPLHLADALGTRVIGLYGPTDPRRNGPYGQLGHVLSEFDRTKLMGSITVEQVMTMLEKVAGE
jgi:heptosyltransferase-1